MSNQEELITINHKDEKEAKQFYFTFKGIFKRIKLEYNYYTKRPWTLTEVGKFWDTVDDYDEVNETLYTYYRRFTNSFTLAEKYLPGNNYVMLDIQARSGKGSAFWHEKNRISKSTCVDFSDYLLSLADERLKKTSLNYNLVKIENFPLPFADNSFNFICTYETIEHVYDYKKFISELTRVLSNEGIIILCCPNVAWEWVHWLTAIININHSEGPHRFLRRKKLFQCFLNNNLEILEENSTIILPFNNKLSIKINNFLESNLNKSILSMLALRRTFILRKT
ncbi:MAG TPA: class I SAM-dependent methyltransferase [Ignavibacteriaceae bacterium]|nr:class I SAM-dependent methyltransferase [Ignavibacteriaceae bacterium]